MFRTSSVRAAAAGSLVAATVAAFMAVAPAAHASSYSGETIYQLKQSCLAYGEQPSPVGSWFDVPTTQVSYGSVGVCAALAQAQINAKYPYCTGSQLLAVDGQDGPLTTAAVKCVQQTGHLEVDGQVGPYTWSALWWVG